MPSEKDCTHTKFRSDIKLIVVEVKEFKIRQLVARLKVDCALCGRPFVFEGQPGFSQEQATTSPDMTELRAPIQWPLREEKAETDPVQ